ncbi:MAG: hypothetical protein WAM94_14415 [Chromatiaceae bacterium]
MNRRNTASPALKVLAAAVFATAFVGPVVAESSCKGSEQRQCEGNSDCTWVDGYTRKDGVKVSSHCKSVGKRDGSSSSSKSSNEKTTASTSTSKASTKAKKSSTKEE